MAERRQAARREPIEISTEDGRVFTAHPLPWMQASDLGNNILEQNIQSANELVHLWVNDAGLPELQMKFSQKITDWQTPLRLAYPNEPEEKWHEPFDLSSDELAEILLVALEVNHLEHIKHLVDPNSPTPMKPGGTNTSQATEGNGTRTESTLNSDSPVSAEPTPSS